MKAQLLEEFARQVKEKTDEMNASTGQKFQNLQAELSAYIGEQTQNLMKQGVPVMEIQNALRAAADRVPQTYAPDANETDAYIDEQDLSNMVEYTWFQPIEETVITAFASGALDYAGLLDTIHSAIDDTMLIEMLEGVNLVLSDFGKNKPLLDVISGGEVVADSSGEAFIPEELNVTAPEDRRYSVSDPAVFKSDGEVKTIAALLEPIDQKAFFKKADINKLLKSGWLEGYDPRSVKEEADYIIGGLWDEFSALREVYLNAAGQGKGMLIFVDYQSEEEDGEFEDEE